MTDTTIFICRKMLTLLDAIGAAGLDEETIKGATAFVAGKPVTTDDKNLAFETLTRRRWIVSYTDDITSRVRWYLSEEGKIARAGL